MLFETSEVNSSPFTVPVMLYLTMGQVVLEIMNMDSSSALLRYYSPTVGPSNLKLRAVLLTGSKVSVPQTSSDTGISTESMMPTQSGWIAAS